MRSAVVPAWAWLLLAMAIVLEVMGTTALRLAQGWRHPLAALAMLICYAASFTAMSYAVRRIPLAVSYAIWSGAGTLLITMVAILWFDESVSFRKLMGMMLVVLGIALIQSSGRTARLDTISRPAP
jgi:small multidrug resistance pump